MSGCPTYIPKGLIPKGFELSCLTDRPAASTSQMGEYQYYADPYDKRDAAKGIRVKKAEGVSSQPFRPASGGRVGATFNRIEVTIAASRQQAGWLHWLAALVSYISCCLLSGCPAPCCTCTLSTPSLSPWQLRCFLLLLYIDCVSGFTGSAHASGCCAQVCGCLHILSHVTLAHQVFSWCCSTCRVGRTLCAGGPSRRGLPSGRRALLRTRWGRWAHPLSTCPHQMPTW